MALGQANGIESTMLDSVSKSNDEQVGAVYQLVQTFAPKQIAFLGISFKEGTDDLRFSPNLKLAQKLAADGIGVKVHDRNVFATINEGINDLEVRNSAGSIYGSITDNLDEVLQGADLIIAAVKSDEYKHLSEQRDIPLIDLVRLDKMKTTGGNYHGLCW